MLNTKDLVALTEHQLVENCNKYYKRHTYTNLFLLMKLSLTSNFDFKKSLTGSIKQDIGSNLLKGYSKILHHTLKRNKEKCNDF